LYKKFASGENNSSANQNMKIMIKRVVIALLLGSAVSLSSCSGSSEDKHISVPEQAKDVQAQSKTEPVVQNSVAVSKGAVKHISQQEFIEKVFDYKTQKTWKFKGDKPCIVDFYADWCKPCKILAPIFEKLAVKYEGKVDFYKINVDENKELSAAFNIQSIPAVLFCPKDGEPQMSMGVLPEEELDKAVQTVLLK